MRNFILILSVFILNTTAADASGNPITCFNEGDPMKVVFVGYDKEAGFYAEVANQGHADLGGTSLEYGVPIPLGKPSLADDKIVFSNDGATFEIASKRMEAYSSTPKRTAKVSIPSQKVNWKSQVVCEGSFSELYLQYSIDSRKDVCVSNLGRSNSYIK